VETDVADVAQALANGERDFVLLDARSDAAYANGHLPGAISLPHARITAETVDELPDGPVVAYCWGPSCNGATKAAMRLAELGRPVKEMLGGFEYWEKEGHPIER
jgi:rhodanese-related sulfurtransferase